jgi:hypothetical protein
MLTRFLDWLDRQNGVVFFIVLWLVRWPLVLPVAGLQQLLAQALGGTSEVEFDGNQYALVMIFFSFVIFAPVIETLVECTLPYAIMMRGGRPRPPRPWRFILVSALVMAVLHLPYAFPAGFVTGAFIAYCYGHFAPQGQPKAFFVAAAYHAAINITGFAMLLLSGD